MRLLTIILGDLVLRENGVRAAARISGAPVSTVASALTRLEAELSLQLVRRGGGDLALSVQGEQLRGSLERLSTLCRRVYRLSPDDGLAAILTTPVTLEALFRLAGVLRAGSIRKAALEMQLGQPQLTRTISQIEQRLGRVLMERGSHGVTPTAEGLALIEVIDELQDRWSYLSRTSDNRFERGVRGRSLGSVIPSGSQSEIAEVMARISIRWLQRFPVPLFIASATAEELMTGLDEGRYDAVLLDSGTVENRYRCVPMLAGRLALYGQDLPDTLAGPELMEALSRAPLALQSLRSGLRQKTTQFLDDFCGPDWRWKIRLMEIDSVPVTLNAVLFHGAISVLPASLRLPAGASVKRLLLPADYLQSLSLISRHDARSQRFVEQIQELF